MNVQEVRRLAEDILSVSVARRKQYADPVMERIGAAATLILNETEKGPEETVAAAPEPTASEPAADAGAEKPRRSK